MAGVIGQLFWRLLAENTGMQNADWGVLEQPSV